MLLNMFLMTPAVFFSSFKCMFSLNASQKLKQNNVPNYEKVIINKDNIYMFISASNELAMF